MSKQSPKSKIKKEPTKSQEIVAEGSAGRFEPQEKKIVIKERTPEEKQKEHRNGIIKTVLAAVLGVLAGFIAHSVYGTGETKPWYAVLFIVIALTYFIQKYLFYRQLDIDVKELKFKDWFFVEFVIIDFFLVTWTILLN